MNIGQVIKELRKQKGLSQKEFADKVKLTQTSLSQIETGTTKPQKGTIDRICKALGINENLLLLLSVDESDVPKHKQELFNDLFPAVRNMMIKIFAEGKTKKAKA